MGNYKNSIELNGKLYDAVTGLPLKTTATHSVAIVAPKTKIRHKTSRTIDGFIRKPKHNSDHKVESPHHQPQAQSKHTESKHAGKQARHHQPQKASTLMRNAVKKPHNPITAGTTIHDKQNAERLERAKSVKKSTLVKHFPSLRSSIQKKHQPLQVQQPPVTDSHNPKSAHATTHQSHTKQKPKSPTEKMLANALHNAHAHEATKLAGKKPRKRLAHRLGLSRKSTNIAVAALAFVLLGGFVVYQNIPNLSMRLASTRAGFEATLPGYQPAGFAMSGPVKYSPGKVTITFSSNSDERKFGLTQQVSNWNSQALVDNYMVANNKQYQTYEEAGKTIFIYDSSNATWVSGGVWYQIEGNSSLNSQQLLSIANSI